MTTCVSRRAAISIAGVLAAAGALGLTGCGSTAEDRSDGPATVTSIDGQQIRLPAPGEPTAVFFFSVGCGECATGMHALGQAAADSNGTRTRFLAVDMDPGEATQTIRIFMQDIRAEHVPVAIDKDAAISRRYGVAALSTAIVVDAHGKVTFRATDPDAATITAQLDKAGV